MQLNTEQNNLQLLQDVDVIERLLSHIDNKSTDKGQASWREPVSHYLSQQRFSDERKLIQQSTTVFCPSAALAKRGDYICRDVAGIPLIVVRGLDGIVRAFLNACRHRGVQLAHGEGCSRALVCPYHGWAYSLDGNLKSIPHADGFPDLDKKTRGLKQLGCIETGGLVFVNQNPGSDLANDIDGLPKMLADNERLLSYESFKVEANWKLYMESSLEGYHIRETHKATFYPVQYDNLTVVERFARNNRIAFPYQAIEGLRNKPKSQWSTDGRLTYVYHLFPNVVISTFPSCRLVVVLEPLTTATTLQHSYLLTDISEDDNTALEGVAKGQKLAKQGALEDQQMVSSAQKGLLSGANDYLEFGLFESAIGHFHTQLTKALDSSN